MPGLDDFLNFFMDILISIIVIPMTIIFAPIDALLQGIPNINAVPDVIAAVFSYVGIYPATMIALTGIHPVLWNVSFTVFTLYIVSTSAINFIKRVWEWVRP